MGVWERSPHWPLVRESLPEADIFLFRRQFVLKHYHINFGNLDYKANVGHVCARMWSEFRGTMPPDADDIFLCHRLIYSKIIT